MCTRRYLFWHGWVIAGLIGFAVGVFAYWTVFFSHDVLHVTPDNYQIIYQRNFPLPDSVMAILGLMCAYYLRRHSETAMLWGLPAAGGILFLGLVDLSHNIWNGHYNHVSGAVACEMFINFYCLAFGPSLMHYLWAHREARQEVCRAHAAGLADGESPAATTLTIVPDREAVLRRPAISSMRDTAA